MSDPRKLDSRVPPTAVPSVWFAGASIAIGSLLAAESLQQWLSSQPLASQFVSPSTWARWAVRLSASSPDLQAGQAEIEYWRVLGPVAGLHVTSWIIGSLLLGIAGGGNRWAAFRRWGAYGGLWWALMGAWDWISIALQLLGADFAVGFWGTLPAFWSAICLAGWMTTWLVLREAERATKRPAPADLRPPTSNVYRQRATLWTFIAIYAAVFITLNARLYANLLIPHGDSAMYEEHLWNLLHGKGFRSYLDQGLFLGEHIQVVHLGLIPLYVFWPNHLLLETCESLALALGAWPVYWMTRRHTESPVAGLAAAAAYLLYPPMQFLDIEIDLKTFRPEAFGIPILLLTLDQLDRRNLWGVLIGVIGCLTVKEDYAVVLAPLGAWIAVFERRGPRVPDARGGSDRRWLIAGVLLMVGSVAYLYLATRIVMPFFRSGGEIHYARYFSKFGETPEEIVRTMVTNPGLLLGEFFRVSTVLYALMLLVPLAFVPLLSPTRLAVGLPMFGILCLNELARDPRHQFHAPLVAIVFWALAGGWARAIAIVSRRLGRAVPMLGEKGRMEPVPAAPKEPPRESAAACPGGLATGLGAGVVAHAVWTSSLAMGLFFSLHPLSLTFWDSGSEWHWRKLYGPSRRAVEFAKIAPLIPRSARVASTDFVHPRFTHHERSYDYSGYLRKVSGYEAKVPDDTDYIVIDTQHRYSRMKQPSDVPEYRDHPEEWELLSAGDYIVLRRRGQGARRHAGKAG